MDFNNISLLVENISNDFMAAWKTLIKNHASIKTINIDLIQKVVAIVVHLLF